MTKENVKAVENKVTKPKKDIKVTKPKKDIKSNILDNINELKFTTADILDYDQYASNGSFYRTVKNRQSIDVLSNGVTIFKLKCDSKITLASHLSQKLIASGLIVSVHDCDGGVQVALINLREYSQSIIVGNETTFMTMKYLK